VPKLKFARGKSETMPVISIGGTSSDRQETIGLVGWRAVSLRAEGFTRWIHGLNLVFLIGAEYKLNLSN